MDNNTETIFIWFIKTWNTSVPYVIVPKKARLPRLPCSLPDRCHQSCARSLKYAFFVKNQGFRLELSATAAAGCVLVCCMASPSSSQEARSSGINR